MRSPRRLWTPTLLALAIFTFAHATPALATLYLGADLPYVNEMEKCGVQYCENGVVKDPFELFHAHRANLVRVRLWNDARWTKYSDLSDVKKTIAHARAHGMQVLLDLHYCEDWADGEQQLIPKAWPSITDPDAMGELETMVRRGRNHPCVILWSLGNEQPLAECGVAIRRARSLRVSERQLLVLPHAMDRRTCAAFVPALELGRPAAAGRQRPDRRLVPQQSQSGRTAGQRRQQGMQQVPAYGHVAWRVVYAPSAIEARGYRGGKLVLSERRETTGKPAAIHLSCDRTTLRANAEDVAVAKVAIVDAQGRLVPTADNQVQFASRGPARLIGVGNGDPSSHEDDKAPQRKAFNGLCAALLQTTRNSGDIVLQATAPRLTSAKLRLPAASVKARASVG